MALIRCGGKNGAITKTKLVEATGSYAGQTVALDTTQYSGFIVEFSGNSGLTNAGQPAYLESGDDMKCFAGISDSGNTRYIYRQIEITTTGIVIGNATYNDNTTDNTKALPTIYGLN